MLSSRHSGIKHYTHTHHHTHDINTLAEMNIKIERRNQDGQAKTNLRSARHSRETRRCLPSFGVEDRIKTPI